MRTKGSRGKSRLSSYMILRDFRGYSQEYQDHVMNMPGLQIESNDKYYLMLRCPVCGNLLTGHERVCPHCHMRIRHKKIVRFLLSKPNVTLVEYGKPIYAGIYATLRFDSSAAKAAICDALLPYIGGRETMLSDDEIALRTNIIVWSKVHNTRLKCLGTDTSGKGLRPMRAVGLMRLIDAKQADIMIEAIRNFMKDNPDSPMITDRFQKYVDALYDESRLIPKSFGDRTLFTTDEIEKELGRRLSGSAVFSLNKRYGDTQLKKIYGYRIADLIKDIDTDI